METKEIERSLTLEEILKTIKSVVSIDMDQDEEHKEEILELTEVVEMGDVNKISPNKDKAPSIFDKIDAAIENSAIVEKQDPIIQQAAVSSPLEVHQESSIVSISPESVNSKGELEKKASAKDNLEADTELQSTGSGTDIQDTDEDLVSEDVIEDSANILRSLISMDNRSSDKSFEANSKLTLEDLVIKTLKPEIAKWLEKNLSQIVQKIVEKEVRKVISKIKKN